MELAHRDLRGVKRVEEVEIHHHVIEAIDEERHLMQVRDRVIGRLDTDVIKLSRLELLLRVVGLLFTFDVPRQMNRSNLLNCDEKLLFFQTQSERREPDAFLNR